MANMTHSTAVGCMAKRLSQKVVVLTHGNTVLAEEIQTACADKGLVVDSRRISRFAKVPGDTADVEIEFEDGVKEIFGFIAHKPRSKLNGPWAEQLGVELTPGLDLKLNPPFQRDQYPWDFRCGRLCQSIQSRGRGAFQWESLPLMALPCRYGNANDESFAAAVFKLVGSRQK